ncbi:hypothetical protein D2Q93_04565 [Alicyclobacillaceae bacterium I2511]|nr:hypothetical protein D2Q93_04565 [Alicyclobacillaceae bacterium I2511]
MFLVLYVIAMVSAIKLLWEEGWRKRMSPFVPSVVCAGLYLLSGWARVYPVVLGLAGWVMSRIHDRNHASGTSLEATPAELW